MRADKRVVFVTLLTSLVMIFICAGLYKQMQMGNDRTLKIGFIYQGDSSTPYDRNFISAEDAIKQEYGERVECVEFYNVREKNLADIKEDLFVENCDLVFATSYGYSELIKEWAKELPDTEFILATGDNANSGEILPNLHNFMGSIHEGRYVTGVVAGAKLKEMIEAGIIREDQAKIGYVGAYPYAEIISGFTAFYLGVYSQVPTVTMDVIYVDSWSDFATEKKAAKQLIESGCVIISQHSDTIGPAVVCQEMRDEYPVIHVGYNGNMIDVAPTTSLISSKINWTPYEVQAVGALLDGRKIEEVVKCSTFGNDSWAGISEGWVEIIGLNEFIAPKGVNSLIKDTINKINRKDFEIFKGPFTATHSVNITDHVDISEEPYRENFKKSAPSFDYLLDDVINIVKMR